MVLFHLEAKAMLYRQHSDMLTMHMNQPEQNNSDQLQVLHEEGKERHNPDLAKCVVDLSIEIDTRE